jgi:hypothetical protein
MHLDESVTQDVDLPVYRPQPPQCEVGTFTYEVIYSDTFPGFINQNPTDQIHVFTQTLADIGDYTFKIKATESISGLFNDADEFVLSILEPIYTQALTIVDATQIADFTFFVYDPEQATPVPQFSVTPADADFIIAYSLPGDTPSFVTLSAPDAETGLPNLLVQTNDPADVGDYDITIIVTETLNSVTESQTFKLTIDISINATAIAVVDATLIAD